MIYIVLLTSLDIDITSYWYYFSACMITLFVLLRPTVCLFFEFADISNLCFCCSQEKLKVYILNLVLLLVMWWAGSIHRLHGMFSFSNLWQQVKVIVVLDQPLGHMKRNRGWKICIWSCIHAKPKQSYKILFRLKKLP